MNWLYIFLVNLIYLPSIYYGVISDDAMLLLKTGYPVRFTKLKSVILHILVAEYIYFAFGCTDISFAAALLFSVHSTCIQVSVWISGRSYGLNALIFLMILAFAPFAITLFFVAEAGIATVLFTPLVFLFTKHWYIAVLFPLLAWYSYDKINANLTAKIEGKGEFNNPLPKDFELHKWNWMNLIIVIKTYGYYFLHCLLPIKNGFYNSFLVTRGTSRKATNYWYSFNRHFWGGLIAIIITVVIWANNIGNFTGMGALLFFLTIGPFLNFITVQQLTAPRYAYLPLIGYQMALMGLVFQLPLPTRCAIIGALFIFYLDRTLRVMPHYKKNTSKLIELESQVFPDNPRVWQYQYDQMMNAGNAVMAWAFAASGLRYLPEDCQLWFGLCCASYELGDMNAAMLYLKNTEKFIMQTDQREMLGIIAEMKSRINARLEKKWK